MNGVKLGKRKTEYRYHVVYYGDGTKGSLKIAKGTLASPAFWEAVDDAEADGAAYCGHHNGRADPDEMVTRFQCRACAAERMDQRAFTNYHPPSERQSLDAIRGGQSATYPPGRYVNNPAAQAEAWHRYRAEDAEREARREEALQLLEEAERASTEVEESHRLSNLDSQQPEDLYNRYDDETAARMAALRKELGIE